MIDPRYIEHFHEWADFVAQGLSTVGSVPVATPNTTWQRWATDVCQLPGIAIFLPPDPIGFSSWRAWAERFSQAVPL